MAVSLTDTPDPDMYVDTGANAHMTNNLGILTNLTSYHGLDKVVVGDGNCLKISHIGDTTVKSSYGSIPLRDVLVVPSIKKKSTLC